MPEKRLKQVVALPEDEQDAIASQILSSLADEEAWKNRLAGKRDVIRRMADEALDEDAGARRVPSDLRHNNFMVKSVEGICRNGKVDLVEPLVEAEGSRVIVTWVGAPHSVDLHERGIDESQAADLRRRLATFAEDWDRPEMTAYDELPPR